MANDVTQTSSTAVALFQKAHGRMTTMQRIDEQIQALIDQRRKLQDELREVQAQINDNEHQISATKANSSDLPPIAPIGWTSAECGRGLARAPPRRSTATKACSSRTTATARAVRFRARRTRRD